MQNKEKVKQCDNAKEKYQILLKRIRKLECRYIYKITKAHNLLKYKVYIRC